MEQNKTENRRSKVLVITALVLLLVLLLSFGGYTLAKYVTSKKVSSGTATVATWGYTVEGNAENVFGAGYEKDANDNAEVVAHADGVDVKALSADAKLIAPGTMGEFTFSVTGKSEVMAKVSATFTMNSQPTVTATASTDTVTYAPIYFTLQTSANGTSYTDVATDIAPANLNAKITEALGANATSIAAGTDVKLYFKVIWNWDFENGNLTAGSKTISADALDTALAENAASYTDENGVVWTLSDMTNTLDFNLSVKVEQVQSK